MILPAGEFARHAPPESQFSLLDSPAKDKKTSRRLPVDVHPPSQPIHSWRDFLVHLLTITIGLLIALALEAAVVSIHHQNVVREARSSLAQEIAGNHELYAKNLRELQQNRDQLTTDIEQLINLRDGKKLESPHLGWGWGWNAYNESAWRTAQASGAVALMNSDSISTYSLIYYQQDYVNSTALSIFNEESRLNASLRIAKDPGKWLGQEIQAQLVKSAEIDVLIATLQSTMKVLDGMYADALKGP